MFKICILAALVALAAASPVPEADPAPKADAKPEAKPQFLASYAAPTVAYTSPYAVAPLAYSSYVGPAVYPSAYSAYYSAYSAPYVVV